jgi:hypothetical protein
MKLKNGLSILNPFSKTVGKNLKQPIYEIKLSYFHFFLFQPTTHVESTMGTYVDVDTVGEKMYFKVKKSASFLLASSSLDDAEFLFPALSIHDHSGPTFYFWLNLNRPIVGLKYIRICLVSVFTQKVCFSNQ